MTDESLIPIADDTVRVMPHKTGSRAAQIAWLLLDASRSPYVVFVNIFVFSAYFTTVVIDDPVRGQVLWSYITLATAIGLAIGAPLLGAIADAGGPAQAMDRGLHHHWRAVHVRAVVRHAAHGRRSRLGDGRDCAVEPCVRVLADFL